MSGRVTEADWGEYGALRLSSDAVSLTLVPDVGARIISLLDRRSGREWLTSGRPPSPAEARAWAAEDALFGGRVSFGWDECLPTVAPCPDPRDPEADALRDHGEQWGRPAPTTPADSGTALLTEWPMSLWGYAFSRRLSLRNETTVLAQYVLQNDSSAPMPMLWSLHPCLRLEPGGRLDLPSVDEVRLTWSSGVELSRGMVAWPTARLGTSTGAHLGGTDLDLAQVRGDEGWAAKFYAAAPGAACAVNPDGSSLRFDWDRSVATSLGIWLAYGGWPPEGESVLQVALEPTTSGHDDLASAIAGGQARVLQPGERLEWWVGLHLSA